jgi:predicted NUDIX family phosphoesterase
MKGEFHLHNQIELRKQLKQKYGNESVLVIPAEDLPSNLTEGFIKENEELSDVISEKTGYMFRYLVEYNTDFRQPIPYILIKHEDKYFATQRLSGSGESRLHGKISLGVGGHVNPVDDDPNTKDTLFYALQRELDEELIVEDDHSIIKEGYINDNSNEVSRDHLAVVYTVFTQSDKVSVRETDKLKGRFYTIAELKENYDNLESWSQLVLDNLLQ